DSFTSEFIRQHGRGDADLDLCRGCDGYNGAPQFRCRDCHGGAMYCQTCIVARHQDNPLHRVYYWTDGHFVKTPLAQLGLKIQLGHTRGSRCSAPDRAKQGFVVIHVNGIHEVNVSFCGCEHSREAGTPEIQVLRAKWFPATHEIPHTCATMEVLDLFHQTVVEAKTSMYHFYAILEKLTNNMGIKPPDRYHEWIRMCREYGHCLLLLQGGQVTAYDSMGVAGIKPGALAIVCPACPRPGVNLDDDWEAASEEDMHLYTWYLALDACFRLKRRLVSNELRDAPLASGSAYMLVDPPFREYLLSVTDQKEMSTCSGLAALDFANTKFSRGYATTGVAMGVCARHEFVQPNGVGDLQRGERFANVDYVFSCIMGHLHPRLRKLVSYDIACIWSKDLVRRCAEDLPPLQRLTLILKFLRFAIPKMHIHSHNVKCQNEFSLNLTKGSAQVDGEGIERPWWWIAGIAAATREMGPGSRHDLLDLLWSYWNWQKLIGLMALLRRRRDRGEPELEQQKEAFEAFSKEQVEHVPAWKKMVHDFEDDPTARNPYELTITGLTEAQVRLRFTEEEAAEAARGAATWHDVTPSKFLVLGLDIEAEQRRVRVQAELKKAGTAGMQIDLTNQRTALNRRITRFRKLQSTYTPAALQALGENQSIKEDVLVEDMPLMLPSALTPQQRQTCKPGLADMEALLRNAQCRTALARLRNQLHIKSRLLTYKKSHSRHQGANTRARTIVARNESKIRLHSEKYQVAWEAIRLLSDDGDPDKVGWQILKKDDIRCMEDEEDLRKKEEQRQAQKTRKRKRDEDLRALGVQQPPDSDNEFEVDGPVDKVPENRRQVSWIWRIGGALGRDDELEEALRIEWCKSYARVRRWTEELALLDVERMRVGRSFEFEARRWDDRRRSIPFVIRSQEVEGAIAYAKRQAAMFRDLRRRGEVTWTEEKLARGKKRARNAPTFRDLEAAGRMDEESERERRLEEEEREREEEERELVQAEVAVEDEFLLGGDGDED
ncbi:hypothetical protein C8R43DRAFT_880503, partial [Mycena crocata]